MKKLLAICSIFFTVCATLTGCGDNNAEHYTDDGNGFSFHDYNAHDMLHVLEHAVGYWYDDRDMWARLMKRAMKTDFSWAVSARKYMELYRGLLGIPEEPKPVRKRAPRTARPAAEKPAAAKPASEKKPVERKPKKTE